MSCDCSAGRVSSRSAPAHPRPETPSTTATPGARCAPEVAPLSAPEARHGQHPAAPRAASAPHRSCSAPSPKSPPTARKTTGETDISNWDGTDICTLPLHLVLGSFRVATSKYRPMFLSLATMVVKFSESLARKRLHCLFLIP